MKTCSAVTRSFGVIAAIVAVSARPFIPRTQYSLFQSALACRRADKLMSFKHFLVRFVEEQ
jgi:hypothetical protein